MHRQQVRRLGLPRAQQPLPILTPPRKHLVGIHSVRPRHLGHRRLLALTSVRRSAASPPPPRRLRGSLLTTIRSEVSTYPPSGHFPMCPLGPSSSTTHTSHTRPEPYAYIQAFLRSLASTDGVRPSLLSSGSGIAPPVSGTDYFRRARGTYGFVLFSTASQSLCQSGGSGATGDTVFGGFDSSSSGNRCFKNHLT